jgi:PAS domain S-box-containing protein
LTISGGILLLSFLVVSGWTWNLLRERRSMNRRFKELAGRALVAERTDHAVFLTDAEGRLDWVNDGFTRITGHLPVDALGKRPGNLLMGTLRNLNVTQKITEAVGSRRAFTVEMFCCQRRGHRYWLSLSMTPVFDEEKQLASFIGVGSDITGRKRAEEEVARIGRRSELLLHAAADGIVGIDIQGAITFVNTAAARLTGWTAEELVGRPVSTILHQLHIHRGSGVRDELFMGAAFIDGTVQIGEVDEFEAKDGTSFPVEYTSTPVQEENHLIGSVIVFRDITDRRQSEALRMNQARQSALRADVAFGLTRGDNLRNFLYRAMQCLVKHLDGAFARVWTLNADEQTLELEASAGIYTHIDGQHGRIPVGSLKVGKIAQDRLPQRSDNLVVDPDIIDKDWVMREGMQSFLGFPLFVEGRLVGVMAMYSRNGLPADGLELMGAVADAIGQGIVRKQAEEKVAEQAALLDRSQDAIVVIDLSARCTYWNKSAARLYGWSDTNVYGRNMEELIFRERASFERAMAITMHRGEWQDSACQIPCGTEFLSVESRWTLVNDEEGRPRSILIVNTDVSEQKRMEAQVLRSQRMESIGTLAGGVAHDLNNVFSPILMSAEVLKSKLSDDQSLRILSMLESGAKRGADMVKQILAFSRGAEGERVLLQPRHLLNDVSRVVSDTFPKAIQFKSAIPEELWPVVGDATLLHQVFLNLTLNARDAMSKGGAMSLSAENYVLETDIRDNGAMILPGFFVRVQVSDTGTGIAPEVLEKMFEPFFTTRPAGEGTGLGLSAVVGIVKSHGGFVQVKTELGTGTTFMVYLPAQEGVQTIPVEKNKPGEMLTGQGELLLAVDDEAAVLSMTRETLETFGYRVLTARDGAEAVEAFTEHRSEISAVLTDMLMPQMDGASAIRVLRRMDPNVRIIASSGLMDVEKVKDVTGLDDGALLAKPYTVEKLLTTVHRVLHVAP